MKTHKTAKGAIASMTAFARQQAVLSIGNVTCEIRSINHRYLETSVSLPEAWRTLEMMVRDRIRLAIRRGKVDCTIRLQAGTSQAPATFGVLNHAMVEALQQAVGEVTEIMPSLTPSTPLDVLAFPGVLSSAKTLVVEEFAKDIERLVQESLSSLVTQREREGASLLPGFLDKLSEMRELLATVQKELPAILQAQRDKLLQRFKDASLSLQSERLEQEMVFFAQKIDVVEEIERFSAHIQALQDMLEQGGVIGRSMDFLLQEMQREANTLGSKSVDLTTTQASMQLKVLIEQIREQAQNIE